MRAWVYGGIVLAVAGGCRRGTAARGDVTSATSAAAGDATSATSAAAGDATSATSAAGSGEFKRLLRTADAPHPLGSETVRGRKFPVFVHVTETNLTLEPVWTSPRKFSYESWAEWSFRQELAKSDEPDAGAGCAREIKVTPVSWLMPLLALREETYQSCAREAHPGGESRLTTLWIDLNEHSLGSPRPVVLTELYDAALIADALRGDALVQKALRGREVPAELGELVRALAETPPVVHERLCYSFPEDLLSRFVLHHLEGEKIAVRLGLPGAGPCRYELTEIGLLLPKPKLLAHTFERMRDDPELPYTSFFVVDRPDMAKTAVVKVRGGPN